MKYHLPNIELKIKLQMDGLKKRLSRWREVTAREFPDRPDLLDMIPAPDGISIKKLNKGTINTDTCNAAQKDRRLLVQEAGDDVTIYQQDCMQHLRCVWINGVSKAINVFMRAFLNDSLEEISSFLRVSPDLMHVIIAYHKEFSLTANYPKGHGEQFLAWVRKHYPNEFLLHTERANGNRQDLVCMGADAIFMNRPLNVEFLDKRLRVRGNENILQQNLFIILSSLEMMAVSRFYSILHVSVVIPFRWLAGNTHKLKKHKWGPRSMGRAMDILHNALIEILADIKSIHDESVMMHIFDELREELPEFDEFLTQKFEKQQTHRVDKSNTKAIPYKMLIKELFSPQDRDNKDSTPMLEKVAAIGIEAFKDEMENEKKASYKYLSISGSEYSYDHCPEEVKEAMLGLMATNDLAESSFAGVTAQVQVYGRIGMCNAAAVSDVARNGFLHRPTTKKEIEKGKRGLYHDLPEELRLTLLIVSMEDAPETRQSNNEGLEKQRECRREKEEVAKQKGLADAEEEYIDRMLYRQMYDSDACWKTARDVDSGIKKLKYQKDKKSSLKDNIMIRIKGLGWGDDLDYKAQWSSGGVTKSVLDLAKELKDIIKRAKHMKLKIPDNAAMPVPQRKAMPILGQLSNQVRDLDAKEIENKDEFHNNAVEKMKALQCDHVMQDPNPPPVDESLVGFRIEMCFEFDIDDEGKEKDYRWCTGVVERVSDGTWVIPTPSGRGRKCYEENGAIEVFWDAVADCNDMPACRTITPISERKWNKEGVGAWRKDLGNVM
jgi:hypothetical protein